MAEQNNNVIHGIYAETQINVSVFSFTWVIKNFQHCYRIPGGFISSPKFTTSHKDEYEWQLRVYPSGINKSYKDDLSLQLRLVSGPLHKRNVHVNLSVIDNQGVKQIKNSMHFSVTRTVELYCENYFEKKDEIRRNYLKNGNLVINCDMYFEDGETEANPIQIIQNLTASDDHRLEVSDDFERLLNAHEHSDATIIVDSTKFYVHKAILAARSPIFAMMFQNEIKEKNENIIEIQEGISHVVMEELLRFIYAGKVNDIQDIAVDLLYAADKYNLERLKIMCEEVITNKISIENIGDILPLIDQIITYKLREIAITFIKKHARQLINTEKFKAAMNELSKDFLKIVIDAVTV